MTRAARYQLPPGPRWPMPLQMLLAVFFTERFNNYCLERFDGLVTLRIAGLGRAVSAFQPELIKTILTGEPERWHGGEAYSRFLRAPAGAHSVLVLDDEQHLAMRRLLLPPFHGEAVRAYTDVIERATVAEIGRWPDGQTFAVHPSMQAITLEVILHAVMGVRDERRRARLRSLLTRVSGANVFAFWAEGALPGLTASALGSRLPWIAARRAADRLVYEEIAEHRAQPDGRDDILAMLIAAEREDGTRLTDAELRDQVMTLLAVGHETTATTLAWCFERLSHHPECLERLQREIASGEQDDYLDAVINETLRTRPVIEQVLRTLTAPTQLGGYTLPAGTVVTVSILGAHMSQAYEQPEEFRPERFLGASAPPYALIPFGGGARRCVGASFALMEIRAILRTTLRHVRLLPSAEHAERSVRWRRFAVSPARGGRVTVVPRKAEAA